MAPAGRVSLGRFMGERVSLMAEDPSGFPWTQGHLGQVCTSCLCDVTGQVPRPLTAMCLCGQPALTISSVHGHTACIMSLPQGPLHPHPTLSPPSTSTGITASAWPDLRGSRLPALLPDASHGKVAFPVIRELVARPTMPSPVRSPGTSQVSSLLRMSLHSLCT